MDGQLAAIQGSSRYEIVQEEISAEIELVEILVEVVEEANDAKTTHPLFAKVVVTASDGSHSNGAENGVYADGRFFIEGNFSVMVPPGYTEILIQSGPNYVPLTIAEVLSPGTRLLLRAYLYRWFSPEERGWYGGDNHVHSQHDQIAKMKTGLEYTALQGKANGLSYITEAGGHVSYDNIDQYSTDHFLLQHAHELGGACYTGHFITPGIKHQVPAVELERIRKDLFPGQGITDLVHQLEGVMIYTHTLTPPHQLHWMSAIGAFSDAVLRRCADAFDVDSKATELLWFAILNLGNRVACSSYTDSTLERKHTLTPGDRRVYCHSMELSYPAIIEAIRQSKTFATNGGPVYAFFSIDGNEVGAVITLRDGQDYKMEAEIRSLYPLRKIELYRKGQVVREFEAASIDGLYNIVHSIQEIEKSWYVLRVEDERGNWCITSPIYLEPEQPVPSPFAATIWMEVSNHSRFVHLRRHYFAHLTVTVSQGFSIEEVHLVKDGEALKSFLSIEGNELSSGKMPVTEMERGSEYSQGWIWYPDTNGKLHLQADYPVVESGWYSVNVRLSDGTTITSDSMYFDQENPYSQELSIAHLVGEDTQFTQWGYGEEMLLEEIKEPYEDHFWYPNNTCWRFAAKFGEQTYELYGDHPYSPEKTSTFVDPKLHSLFKPSFNSKE